MIVAHIPYCGNPVTVWYDNEPHYEWDCNVATNPPSTLYISRKDTPDSFRVDASANLAPCDFDPPTYSFTASASGGLRAVPSSVDDPSKASWMIVIANPGRSGTVQITAQASHGNAIIYGDCGPVTIRATATIIYEGGGNCCDRLRESTGSDGSFGSGDPAVSSVEALSSMNFRLLLGQTPYGTRAGYLELESCTNSLYLAQPSGLRLPFTAKNVTVLTNASGAIQQVRTTQGLVNVAVIDQYNYALQCFYDSSVGSTNGLGFYQTNAAAFSTWFIGNPDGAGATNRLCITNAQGGTTLVYRYSYSESDRRWELVKPDGQTNSAWTAAVPGTGLTNYCEQISISGRVLMQSQETYSYVPAVACSLLTQLVEGAGDQTRTNTYSYYTQGNGSNLLQQVNYWDGHWAYHVYDSYSRIVTNYEAYNNSAPPTSGGFNPATQRCKETTFAYAYDPGPDPSEYNILAYIPYTTTVSLPARLGDDSWVMKPVSRTDRSITLDDVYHFRDSVRRWDAANNAWLDSGSEISLAPDFTQGRPLAVVNEDGSVISYTYQDQFTTYEGDPDGSQKTTIVDDWGNPVAFTNVDLTTTPPVVLDTKRYTYTNAFGSPYDELRRSHDETDLAGRTTKYRWYDCCGGAAVTNADGVATVYTNDVLKRLVATTVYHGAGNGIETTNVLDAMGRVLVSTRKGTDQSPVTLAQYQYDVLGNIIRQTNALDGITRTTNVVINGQRYITNTYPNGGTRVEAYYRDGRLQSVTGSAVQGVQYTYDMEQDPNNTDYWREVTTETKLDADGNVTSEWTKTFADGFGRPYLTLYSAPSAPYPSRQSFYNSQGRLWKVIDPDGYVTFYTYYDNSADINQGDLQYTIIALDPNTQQISDYGTLVAYVATIQQAGGVDRLTRQQQVVVPAANGKPDLIESSTYAWTDGEMDGTGTLLSTSAVSTSGLTNWTTTYRDASTAVVSQQQTAYYIAGNGYSITAIAPDNSYTVSSYPYGRLSSVIRCDANGTQLGMTSYAYDAHGRQYQVTDARN